MAFFAEIGTSFLCLYLCGYFMSNTLFTDLEHPHFYVLDYDLQLLFLSGPLYLYVLSGLMIFSASQG